MGRGTSKAGGGAKTNTPNIQMTARNNTSYSEGAIFERNVNNLMTRLDSTRSRNGAERIVNSLENTKRNIQTHIDTANFQIRQGNRPSEDLPSLKRAMGAVNRAITKARRKVNSSPSVGTGRATRFT